MTISFDAAKVIRDKTNRRVQELEDKYWKQALEEAAVESPAAIPMMIDEKKAWAAGFAAGLIAGFDLSEELKTDALGVFQMAEEKEPN